MARLNKEQILLAATVVVCAGLYLRGASADPTAIGSIRAGRTQEKELPESSLGPRLFPFPRIPTAVQRDIFQPPRESEPLAPLTLAPPPRDELPLIAPIPVPGPGPGGFFVLRLAGEVLLDPPVLASPSEEGAGSPDRPGTYPGFGPTLAVDPPPAQDPASLKRRYDWIEDRNGITLWGFILNRDRFDLKTPLDRDQVLELQQVNPKTGAPITSFPIAGDRILRFGLAETVSNWIELRKRAIPRGQAYDQERRTFILSLLEKAEESVEALQEARRQADYLVADSPDAPLSWETMARVYGRSGDLEGEYKLYRRLSEKTDFKQRAFVRIGLGRVYERLTLLRKAEHEYRQAVQFESSAWEALMALGRFLMRGGRHSEALPFFQRAVQSIQFAPLDARARFETRSQVSAAFLGLGRIEEAWEEARRARQVGIEAPDIDLLEGVVLLCRKEFAEALVLLERAVEGAPERAEPGLALGIAQALNGDYAQALTTLEGVLRIDPLIRPRVLAARAWILRRVGLIGDALIALESGLRMAPDDPYLLYLAGRVRREDGDLKGARAALSKLLRRYHDVPEILVEMARVALEDDALLEAESFAARAIEMAGQKADAAWDALLGDIFLLLKRTSEAEEVFRRAVKRDRCPHARIGLAQVAYYRGDLEAAVDLLRRMIEGGEFPPEDRWLLFAQDLHARIVTHAAKEQVFDDFQRAEIGLRWRVMKLAQAVPRIQEGVLLLEGPLERERWLGVIRENEEPRLFVSVEVECRILPGHRAEAAGLRLGLLRPVGRALKGELEPEVALWWDAERDEGLVQVTGARMRADEERRPLAVPPELWRRGETVRLRVEFGGEPVAIQGVSRTTLRLFVADQLVRSLELPELARGAGKLQIELFARGKTGERANIQFDNFRLVRRKEAQ